MMKGNNQLDELFRSKLESFEQEPPSYVWSRIQESQKGTKRKKAFLFWKVTGVAAAVLLAFVLGWQLQGPSHYDVPFSSSKHEPVNRVGHPQTAPESVQGQIAEGDRAKNKKALIEKQSSTSHISSETTGKQAGKQNFTNSKNNNYFAQIEGKGSQNASNSHEKIEAILNENSQLNKEQFQLLRLLGIHLNGLSGGGQLVEVLKLEHKKAKGLSAIELAQMSENAQLLASNKETQKSGAWQVGAMFTPGYNVNQSSQSAAYASNMAVSGQKEELQLGGGISVEYKTGKRWSVQSGVYYSKLDQSSSNQSYNAANVMADYMNSSLIAREANYFNTAVNVKAGEVQLNTPVGVVAMNKLPANAKLSSGFEALTSNDGILLTQTDFEQFFEYVEIPVIVRYQLIDAAFNLELLGGFNTSVLIGNNAYAVDQSGREKIGSTQDMNLLNYSTSVGFGVGYGLTKNINLHVEPQFKYFLGSLTGNSNITFKPYTIGITTGLSYQF